MLVIINFTSIVVNKMFLIWFLQEIKAAPATNPQQPVENSKYAYFTFSLKISSF